MSYTDQEGIEHAVEVEAESLYEAVALAVSDFRGQELQFDEPKAMTRFTVTVSPSLDSDHSPENSTQIRSRQHRRRVIGFEFDPLYVVIFISPSLRIAGTGHVFSMMSKYSGASRGLTPA